MLFCCWSEKVGIFCLERFSKFFQLFLQIPFVRIGEQHVGCCYEFIAMMRNVRYVYEELVKSRIYFITF